MTTTSEIVVDAAAAESDSAGLAQHPAIEVGVECERGGSDGGADEANGRNQRWRRRRPRGPLGADGDAPARRRLRAAVTTVVRWIGAAVLIAALVAAGYEGWLLAQQHQNNIATAQAVDAANKYAVALTSTAPDRIDQDIAEVLDGATGDFKDTYIKASSRLRKALIEQRVVTRGTVIESAVKGASKNRVEALLLVRESVSNSTSPDAHTELTAVAITMENVNGRWLASRVAVLPE